MRKRVSVKQFGHKAYIDEGPADVQVPALLRTDKDSILGDVLAFGQYPRSSARGTITFENLRAGLSLGKPVLRAPSLGLFLFRRN